MCTYVVIFLIICSRPNHYFLKKLFYTPKKLFVCLPFLDALSLQTRNEIKSFLSKHNDDKAILYIINTLSKIGGNFHLKNQQPLRMNSRVVNKPSCSFCLTCRLTRPGIFKNYFWVTMATFIVQILFYFQPLIGV